MKNSDLFSVAIKLCETGQCRKEGAVRNPKYSENGQAPPRWSRLDQCMQRPQCSWADPQGLCSALEGRLRDPHDLAATLAISVRWFLKKQRFQRAVKVPRQCAPYVSCIVRLTYVFLYCTSEDASMTDAKINYSSLNLADIKTESLRMNNKISKPRIRAEFEPIEKRNFKITYPKRTCTSLRIFRCSATFEHTAIHLYPM
jgi:hypothetical protein